MQIEHDRAREIFGNRISDRTYKSACRAKLRHLRKHGPDSMLGHITAATAPVIGEAFGVRELLPAPSGSSTFDIAADAASLARPEIGPRTLPAVNGKPLVVGTIRMGFGHYRIAIAIASAARALGFTPYWLDFCGFPETAASKIVNGQNELYSFGSRLSQRFWLFNKLVWEPLNSEGFRKLSTNAKDQKMTELLCAPLLDLPRSTPFVGAHAWPSQAAVHAGFTHVANAIPDNWPMALHLAEGSIHTVQTESSYLGYKMLRGMDKHRVLRPMPAGSIACTGHYVDHELVSNISFDCHRRIERMRTNQPIRYLLTIGGAGAQQDLYAGIIEHVLPLVKSCQATLLVNVGDHLDVWNALRSRIPALEEAVCHFSDWNETASFVNTALDSAVSGIHAFYDEDIFAAVYATNVLMRACDVLVTKPSELSFYPVPKLMIKRVGGHEAWGAIRAAELGDGTYEMETLPEICAMIDAFQEEPELIEWMCENIMSAGERGVYDGAYEVVKLAAGL